MQNSIYGDNFLVARFECFITILSPCQHFSAKVWICCVAVRFIEIKLNKYVPYLTYLRILATI